ncbi:MAG TPA: diaminopimelate epimerase [Planctomycetota bacterium]|nr:diaminopimelate epimerase [Planctomycetota bacterium]
MKLAFWKMNGAGNDFVVADNRGGAVAEKRLAGFAEKFCHRRTGVGADGVLLVEKAPAAPGGLDFRMRYLNADGSEASMCGNGARCIASYAHAIGAAPAKMRFLTGAGPVGAEVTPGGAIIDMPEPTEPEPRYVDLAGRAVELWFLSTGVPHAVVPVGDLENCDIVGLGRALRRHAAFAPAGTNVNFITRQGQGLAIRTYERGVEDETLACGTGASAAALTAARIWKLSSPVPVAARGGNLRIHFAEKAGRFTGVRLEGPVQVSFRGELEWE